MFLARFPLEFPVLAAADQFGHLEFVSTHTILRFARIPEHPELFPRFAASGLLVSAPWAVEEATPEGSGCGRLRLRLNGAQLTALVDGNPNHELYLALLDQSPVHLQFKMGPIDPEEPDGEDYLYGVIVLKPMLVVAS